MGSNRTQAYGFLLFLAAFVAVGAAMFMGGSIPLFLIGLVLLAGSVGFFRKAKPWEHGEG